MQSIQTIFVNLPVKDIAKTRLFWEGLGFAFHDKYSDEKAICMVLQEDHIYVMLILESFFTTFTNRPLADGKTTQVLFAIQVDSRETVKDLISKALATGAKRYREAVEQEGMYYDTFADPDGHQWEVMYMRNQE